MTDATEQRIAMVESQVRPSDVTDRRILRAMLEVPREEFAPPPTRLIAYSDAALPVTPRRPGRQGRYLLAPRTLAKLLQVAEIGPDEVVLDVGCASGYSIAMAMLFMDLSVRVRRCSRGKRVAGVETIAN